MNFHTLSRIFIVVPAFLIVMFASAGCGHGTGKTSKDITIGVVVKYESSTLFAELEKAIRQAAQNKNIAIKTLAPGTRDAESQSVLFKALLESNVKAIIFAPENSRSCLTEVAEAHRKNIPVILIDTDLDRDKAPVTTLVGCDNVEGGRIAGGYLAAKMAGKGTALILQGSQKSHNGALRVKGFNEVMAGYGDITVITSPPARYNRTTAFQVCRKIFEKRKDIKGIFALNDEMALGVYDALLVTKMEKPFIIGYNATKPGIEAIRNGRFDATVNQFPDIIGSKSIDCAIKALEGEKLPPYIYIKPELVTREKLEMPFH